MYYNAFTQPFSDWNYCWIWRQKVLAKSFITSDYRVMLREFDGAFKIQGLEFKSCRRTSQVSKMFVYFFTAWC